MFWKRIFLFFLLATSFAACGPDYDERQIVPLVDGGSVIARWNDLFVDETTLPLSIPADSPPLLVATQLLLGRNGELIIPDGRNHRILFFNAENEMVREIGGKGQGPGEFNALAGIALDSQGRLLTYDADGRRLSIFSPQDFQYQRSLPLSTYVTIMASDAADRLLVYTPYQEKVFLQFDLEQGKLLRAVYRPDDEKLRIFLGRIQTGGLVADPEGGGFFGLYPEDFSIRRYDGDLRLVSVYHSDASSKWRPRPSRFPSHLSPYEHEPAHERWWESQLHAGRIFLADRNHLVVTLFESESLQAKARYVNVYRTDGTIVAEGVEIPGFQRLLAVHQGYAYLVEDAALDADGSLRPLQLRRFRLKDLPAPPESRTAD